MGHPPGTVTGEQVKDLDSFRAEANAVLAGPADEWPSDVFAEPDPGVRIEAAPR